MATRSSSICARDGTSWRLSLSPASGPFNPALGRFARSQNCSCRPLPRPLYSYLPSLPSEALLANAAWFVRNGAHPAFDSENCGARFNQQSGVTSNNTGCGQPDCLAVGVCGMLLVLGVKLVMGAASFVAPPRSLYTYPHAPPPAQQVVVVSPQWASRINSSNLQVVLRRVEGVVERAASTLGIPSPLQKITATTAGATSAATKAAELRAIRDTAELGIFTAALVPWLMAWGCVLGPRALRALLKSMMDAPIDAEVMAFAHANAFPIPLRPIHIGSPAPIPRGSSKMRNGGTPSQRRENPAQPNGAGLAASTVVAGGVGDSTVVPGEGIRGWFGCHTDWVCSSKRAVVFGDGFDTVFYFDLEGQEEGGEKQQGENQGEEKQGEEKEGREVEEQAGGKCGANRGDIDGLGLKGQVVIAAEVAEQMRRGLEDMADVPVGREAATAAFVQTVVDVPARAEELLAAELVSKAEESDVAATALVAATTKGAAADQNIQQQQQQQQEEEEGAEQSALVPLQFSMPTSQQHNQPQPQPQPQQQQQQQQQEGADEEQKKVVVEAGAQEDITSQQQQQQAACTAALSALKSSLELRQPLTPRKVRHYIRQLRINRWRGVTAEDVKFVVIEFQGVLDKELWERTVLSLKWPTRSWTPQQRWILYQAVFNVPEEKPSPHQLRRALSQWTPKTAECMLEVLGVDVDNIIGRVLMEPPFGFPGGSDSSFEVRLPEDCDCVPGEQQGSASEMLTRLLAHTR